MMAPDVKIGATVLFNGGHFTVWAKGPQPGTFWIATTTGMMYPEPVRARDLGSLAIRSEK